VNDKYVCRGPTLSSEHNNPTPPAAPPPWGVDTRGNPTIHTSPVFRCTFIIGLLVFPVEAHGEAAQKKYVPKEVGFEEKLANLCKMCRQCNFEDRLGDHRWEWVAMLRSPCGDTPTTSRKLPRSRLRCPSICLTAHHKAKEARAGRFSGACKSNGKIIVNYPNNERF
jgi:hypothetical protein